MGEDPHICTPSILPFVILDVNRYLMLLLNGLYTGPPASLKNLHQWRAILISAPPQNSSGHSSWISGQSRYGSHSSTARPNHSRVQPICARISHHRGHWGTLYAYGTEIATLRLFHKMNMMGHCRDSRTAYSKNLNTWYFSLPTAA